MTIETLETASKIATMRYDGLGRRNWKWVYRSAGSNDPRCHAPTIESQRCQDGWNVAPYSLCDFGHQGLLFDKEFGLCYNRARYYHPRLMRWISTDPKGYVDGMNLYEYERSGPVTRRDASGTRVVCRKEGFAELLNEYGIDPERVPDEKYRGDDLHTFEAAADLESATKGDPKKGEILVALLKSPRLFIAEDGSVEELKKHIEARYRAVNCIKDVAFRLADSREKFKANRTFWRFVDAFDAEGKRVEPKKLLVAKGASASQAVVDMWSSANKTKYVLGCGDAAFMPMLYGVIGGMDSEGKRQFDAATTEHKGDIIKGAIDDGRIEFWRLCDQEDWVPGDFGYVSRNGGNFVTAGQFILYLGQGSWWGLVEKGGKEAGIEEWIAGGNLRRWRLYPMTGLKGYGFRVHKANYTLSIMGTE